MASKDIQNTIIQTLILLMLKKGTRMYPFQICRSLKPVFDGFFEINDGLIDRQMQKLEAEELIECEVVIIAGIKRKYYILTAKGISLLIYKVIELEEFMLHTTNFISSPLKDNKLIEVN